MATTDYNVKFDKKVINHIKPFLPKSYIICDFDDDSDAKSNTVNYRKSQGIHGVLRIAGVKNKTYLRALIYDPKRDIFRYVAVWDWPSSLKIIELSADPNTSSKYLDGRNGIELKSFKELAQFNFKNK